MSAPKVEKSASLKKTFRPALYRSRTTGFWAVRSYVLLSNFPLPTWDEVRYFATWEQACSFLSRVARFQ